MHPDELTTISFIILSIIIIYFWVKFRHTQPPIAKIDGTIFATIDEINGEADASITITDLEGNVVDGGSGVTDINGNFNFSLGPGTYKLVAVKGEFGFEGEFEVSEGMATVTVVLRTLIGS